MNSRNPYTFFSRFCLRTPISPLGLYMEAIGNGESIDTKLITIWEDPMIQEAIFLASPELHTEISKWSNGSITDKTAIRRLRFSFLKYLSRMSSRCTPFGLFAGCSLGSFENFTRIDLAEIPKYQRQTRFDMNFLVAFSQHLSKEDRIKNQLLWYPNNSLYRIGQQYRYVEYRYNKHNRREHSLEAVTHTEYLQEVLEKAISGTTTKELADVLVNDEISEDEALDFITLLIDNQILVSALEPSVTGEGFLQQIEKVLTPLNDGKQLVKQITKYQENLDRLDKGIGNPALVYEGISKDVQKTKVPYELKFLFQTDLYPKTISNTLDAKWAYKIKRLMPLLNRFTSPSKNGTLDQFINAFTKRYETREVPLATALDTEIGIGYLQNQRASDSTPFLEGLEIPFKKIKEQQLPWDAVQEIFSKKFSELEKGKDYELLLQDSDFDGLEENWNDLPDTMSTMVELVRIEDSEKMVLSSIGGTSATALMGRFTTGNTEMLEYIREIASIEQRMNPNNLLAEIIHVPESRTGNVIRRAAIRNYEIPYLGKSSVPSENQIPIGDLMISVRNGRIRLRSLRLNAYILPRLGNAHNFSANALPIYHFLCDMQKQNVRSGIGFYWGSVLQQHRFLPRIVYKDFILSKARWRVRKEDIERFLKLKGEELISEMAAWRKIMQLPKLVHLVEGDNTLLINLDNREAIEMLMDAIKKKTECILEEFLFSEDCIVSRGKEGFTNQFVISFYNEEKLKRIEN